LDDDLEKKLLGGAAYKLFFDECKVHYESCKEAFSRAQLPNDEELQLLATRVHTIKGGSGFFKLTELTQVTGQLEKLFGQGSKALGDLESLKALLAKFAECVDKLQPPKAS